MMEKWKVYRHSMSGTILRRVSDGLMLRRDIKLPPNDGESEYAMRIIDAVYHEGTFAWIDGPYEETFQHWEGKKAPGSIDVPKLIRVGLGLTFCSWKCPTCKCETTFYADNSRQVLNDRCCHCGQKIYFDSAEIDEQPYYKALVERRDQLAAKERGGVYKNELDHIKLLLADNVISKKRYDVMKKLADANLAMDQNEVFRLNKLLENKNDDFL